MKIKKFDFINVVPFIDIMLVLLAIVLTTATFVAKGIIPVELTKSSNSKPVKIKSLTITITKNGELFFDKNKIYEKDISKKLSSYKKNVAININCDKNSKFEYFAKIVDILKNKGYTNLGIVAKNE